MAPSKSQLVCATHTQITISFSYAPSKRSIAGYRATSYLSSLQQRRIVDLCSTQNAPFSLALALGRLSAVG